MLAHRQAGLAAADDECLHFLWWHVPSIAGRAIRAKYEIRCRCGSFS
jgi:hypothetical protein